MAVVLNDDRMLRVLLVVAFDVVPGGLVRCVAFVGQTAVDDLFN